MIRAAVRYALPLVIGGIFVWFANNGIRFVIEHSEGTAAVGLMTVGWGLGIRAATSAAMLVTAAAFPLAVSKSREYGVARGQEQLVENGVLLLAALAPATAGLWVISQPLVGVLVAEPFREMTAHVLPWAILAGAFRSLRIHFGQHVFLLREETLIPLATDVVRRTCNDDRRRHRTGVWRFGGLRDRRRLRICPRPRRDDALGAPIGTGSCFRLSIF